MGVIQREIEKTGVSTVSLSLVREFTEKVRPPRALWVPFPFGRPLGAPGRADVQRKVIEAALALLSAPKGPVFAEFVLDAADEQLDAKYQALGRKCGPAGCSLEEIQAGNVPVTEPQETPYDGRLDLVLAEIRGLKGEHLLYRRKRNGRTAVGASGATPETIDGVARAIDAFIRGASEMTGPQARLLVDDLKSFYMESRVEMAPEENGDASRANDWFWLDTWAGRMIIAARDRFVQVTDRAKDPNWIVARAIVPRGYGKSSYTLGHVTGKD